MINKGGFQNSFLNLKVERHVRPDIPKHLGLDLKG